MFHIELDVFSGRPNPRWTLEPAEESQLLERVLDRTVPVAPMIMTDAKLGYRGFLVIVTGATAGLLQAQGLPTAFRVRDGLGATVDLQAERWLLFTARPRVERRVLDVAEEGLVGPARCPTPYLTSSTAFFEWNGGDWMWWNNCYNYAANYRTDSFAQPGYGTGDMYADLTVDEIRAAAVRDGFRTTCGGWDEQNLQVWFCIAPGLDYHWYRRTRPMRGDHPQWCHKLGGSPARSTDESGAWIEDPRTADRGGYTEDGAFLYSLTRQRKTVDGPW